MLASPSRTTASGIPTRPKEVPDSTPFSGTAPLMLAFGCGFAGIPVPERHMIQVPNSTSPARAAATTQGTDRRTDP